MPPLQDARVPTQDAGQPQPDAAPENVHVEAIQNGSKTLYRATATAAKPSVETPSAPAEERPAWLPEKFKTPEDMAKAYAEMEKRLSRGEAPKAPEKAQEKAQEPPEGQPEGETQDQTSAPREQAQETLKARGLDLAEFESEYLSQGQLSDESFEKLEKAGFPRQMVEKYVKGLEAERDAALNSIFAVAGGREQFAKMIEWAKDNVSPEEIAAYNRLADMGDVAGVKAIASGFYARYSREAIQEPRTHIGGSRPAAGDVFRSNEEVIAAVRDPRYKTDPAYRRAYEEKLARSDVFGMGRQR